MKRNCTTFFYLLVLTVGLLFPMSSYAQQERLVSGVVTDSSGPVAGATITVEGTRTATISDAEGLFSIQANSNQTLNVSFIGYEPQSIAVGDRTSLNISLATDSTMIGEVVVTALGVSREKKSLGSALQEVSGDVLANRRELNVTNALSGEVAGLQVIRSSNGPAGSAKIVLRGNNSLTGDNQPLIVVDGIPMDNGAGAINSDMYNPSLDMGNGLADISADDIKSMTVLKGGSAAALYGSRAGNGVILITTKTGGETEGLGITISSTVSSSSPFLLPELQSSFGQGSNGVFNATGTTSWGPAIEGQSVTDWRGETVNMAAYDNLANFMNRGLNLSENITFQQQLGGTSLYTSFGRTDDKSMIPGAKYGRTNLTTHSVSKFGKDNRWTLDAKVSYINSKANNRPLNGAENQSNIFYALNRLPRSLDIRDFNPSVDADGKMIWYEIGGTPNMNPYWTSKYNLNQDIRDRFLLSGALQYKFTDWLDGEIRGGGDLYTTTLETKKYAGSSINPTGSYSSGHETFSETNLSFLFTGGQDDLFGQFGLAGTFGGNLMKRGSTKMIASVSDLQVPNLFMINNAMSSISIDDNPRYGQKKINSLYGSLQMNWDGYIFLDGTLRNDWTSTLSKDNRSYLYPSVSLSYVFTDMAQKINMNLPNWFSFAKLRGSYAEVGNDMNPYQLYNTYVVGRDPNGNTTVGSGSTLFNANVKNENIKTAEVGIEARFLNDRLRADFAWYKSNATNQLIAIPRDPLSGYSAEMVNMGNIQNKGIELTLNALIFDRPSGFTWDLGVNYSVNKNTIEDLGDAGTTYRLGGYDQLSILAVDGGEYGEIHGTKFQRVTDESSEYFGKIIVNESGLPLATVEASRLGTQQASALLGVTNTFAFKGFNLSFLIDARFGGKIFSASNSYMQLAGTAAATAPGGKRDDVVFDGVVASGDTYIPNTASITTQQLWETLSRGGTNLGINEFNTYDATNIRLRNVQLNYSFNKRMLAQTPFQQLSVGVSCNNVWMLRNHLNGIDPESVFATGTNAVGFEAMAPPTVRTFMFNITLGF
jgi:TonB-linked SusC/RagA family outer membrane protein